MTKTQDYYVTAHVNAPANASVSYDALSSAIVSAFTPYQPFTVHSVEIESAEEVFERESKEQPRPRVKYGMHGEGLKIDPAKTYVVVEEQEFRRYKRDVKSIMVGLLCVGFVCAVVLTRLALSYGG